MRDLTERQRHALVALLELEESDRAGHIYAGQIAWKMGYRLGPRQGGNGAKDGRSFSGYGATGKWVLFSLLGLEKRGLLRRSIDIFGDHRVTGNSLTPEGREVAEALRTEGVEAAFPGVPERYAR